MPKKASVYISYARSQKDSAYKKHLLLNLVHHLKEDDINIEIDFLIKDTCKNFFQWMDNCLDNSDFILLICDEDLYMKYKDPSQDHGLGIAHEMNRIYALHYRKKSDSEKIIPILLNPEDTKYIPDTFFCINYKILYDIDGNWQENEYESLYNILTHRNGFGEIESSYYSRIHQIFQTNNYNILQNKNNDLMLLIRETGHEQNDPTIFYDGNENAVFVNKYIYIYIYIGLYKSCNKKKFV